MQSAQPNHHQRQSRSSFSSHVPIPIAHSALPSFARAGSIHNSPTANESFSHSLSKLGLSRSRRVADDVASIYSDSTVARVGNASAEAAMRRLRGEVSGVKWLVEGSLGSRADPFLIDCRVSTRITG